MSEALLDRFLEKGLLDLKGNDEWYERIIKTAKSLSTYLRANPEKIVPFTYAALLPDVGDRRSGHRKNRYSFLKSKWKTYASVSMASPKVMLRAIIFEALLENAAVGRCDEVGVGVGVVARKYAATSFCRERKRSLEDGTR